ncbi:hypothetical protein CB0940_07775 [Cercospora beticola]|uniref:Uncharacterized protein n=1 Tax=Cercospora beticola TaxID=122368 RepID=A0A2G5H892_CERBT|nr:hypothetical protein CB0940_07775 [Cercospora beticola]PIA88748.1 hypothetical protein CB0940_07775 [Cercospora beticola]WPB03743.1 hypothetical protein RHO25_008387 [Cercospora beticola]CAK1357495.1 unnamed protein product [Cercospora beticola]
MVGLMASQVPEANCAICGAPPFPECPHEGERLELALNQAWERWAWTEQIKKWVLDHARNQIITTFNEMRAMRVEAHRNYLQTLPFYTLYHRYNGAPPLAPAQLQLIHSQINAAHHTLQQGVDQDWRTSCMQYPQVLDYYFNLVNVRLPNDNDPMIADPRFGAPKDPPRRVKERRESVEYREAPVKEHRKKERRRSRTGNTPPPVPMPDRYDRYR